MNYRLQDVNCGIAVSHSVVTSGYVGHVSRFCGICDVGLSRLVRYEYICFNRFENASFALSCAPVYDI